ncbi:hypothetical protein LTR10_022056 [Elasticomyces elasticus]|uniref:Uncharacterized protein n=1 Tax=Exophiala sideris TaxID=1016849 RepID=A0ABR0JM70_9EURO|nr:hypothetical protein LTR10_022056 [Elasticomyces elasticus]KAK5036491.1 hypothetical protein LTS07_002218 [Exophiala sideris]KAK5041680.1 hypothetical protein LTR13_002347 [Exophiala sideris]KAK5066874.1 hypothetical protein LTR69_002222 [Exophiala sideris]KAK5184933.1 hypothetical protein LTR44_002779 [Eurotiomycetes sp. CCFEE 6388]
MAGDNIFWSNFLRKLREWWYTGYQTVPTISFPLDASGISQPTVFNSPSWVEESLAFLTIPRVGVITATSHQDTISLNIDIRLPTHLQRPLISHNISAPLLHFEKVVAPPINASRTIPVNFDDKPKSTAVSSTDLTVYTGLPISDIGSGYACNWDSQYSGTWLEKVNYYMQTGRIPVAGFSHSPRSRQPRHVAPPAKRSPEDNIIINGLFEDLMTGRLGQQMVDLGLIEQSDGDSTVDTAPNATGFATLKLVLRKLMAIVTLLRVRLAQRTAEAEALTKANDVQKDSHRWEIQQKDNDITAKDELIQAKEDEIQEKNNESAFQQQSIQSKNSRISALEQEIVEKDNVITSKDTELEQKDDLIAAKQDLIDSKETTISEKEKSLKLSEETNGHLLTQNEDLRKKCQGYEGTPAFRERHEKLQDSSNELQAAEHSLRQQFENRPDPDEQLQKDNEKLTKEKDKLQERFNKKIHALEKAKAELDEKDAKIAELEKPVETKTNDDTTTHDGELEQLKSEISQTLSTLSQTRSENSELQSTIGDLRAQTSELTQVRSMNTELQSTIDSLRAQLAASTKAAQTTQSTTVSTPSPPFAFNFGQSAQPVPPQATSALFSPSTPAAPNTWSAFRGMVSASEPEPNFAQTRTPVEAAASVAPPPSVSPQAVFPVEQTPEFAQTSDELFTGPSTAPSVRLLSTDTSRGRTPTEPGSMRSRHSIRYGSPPRNADGIPTRPLTQREREAKKQRDAETAAITAASTPSRGSTVASNEVQQGQQKQVQVAATAVNEATAPVAPRPGNIVVALPAANAPEVHPAVEESVAVNQESQVASSSPVEVEDNLEFAPGGFGEDESPFMATGGDAGTGGQESVEVESDDMYGAQETASGSSVGQSTNETVTTTPLERPTASDADRAARKAKTAEEGLKAVKASKWAVNQMTAEGDEKDVKDSKWALVEDEKKADKMGKEAVLASRWAPAQAAVQTPVTRVRAARSTPLTPPPRALDHGIPRLNSTQDQPGSKWTPVGAKKPIRQENHKD